ncbi:hypothetical protein FHS01_001962 [Longimicrobium terrae]|uniref:Uncharacterized protein n=1 Tax=Longimicrobium terrae TaxID=1639882 RepID=A0A841GRS7_9BACT|nr:hypothetical protein [Longimicrobium terrae]MBB6070342.1 hypothetical protein [Longimicrobium terrae]
MSSVRDESPGAGTPAEGAVRPGQRPLLGRLLRSPGAALAGIAAVLIAAGRGVPTAAPPRRDLASPTVGATQSAPFIDTVFRATAPSGLQDPALDALFARYDALIRHIEFRSAQAPSPALDSALLRLRRLRQETWAETRRALAPAESAQGAPRNKAEAHRPNRPCSRGEPDMKSRSCGSACWDRMAPARFASHTPRSAAPARQSTREPCEADPRSFASAARGGAAAGPRRAFGPASPLGSGPAAPEYSRHALMPSRSRGSS